MLENEMNQLNTAMAQVSHENELLEQEITKDLALCEEHHEKLLKELNELDPDLDKEIYDQKLEDLDNIVEAIALNKEALKMLE